MNCSRMKEHNVYVTNSKLVLRGAVDRSSCHASFLAISPKNKFMTNDLFFKVTYNDQIECRDSTLTRENIECLDSGFDSHLGNFATSEDTESCYSSYEEGNKSRKESMLDHQDRSSSIYSDLNSKTCIIKVCKDYSNGETYCDISAKVSKPIQSYLNKNNYEIQELSIWLGKELCDKKETTWRFSGTGIERKTLLKKNLKNVVHGKSK